MNNYCRNCGEKLENNIKVCPKCNAEVFENRVNVEQRKNELEKYKKKENMYIIVIIILYASAYLSPYYFRILGVYNFISYIIPLLYLAATITLIYARITMNKSQKIRIMFNIFMILIVLYLFFIIFMFITCTGVLNKGC